MQRTGRRPISLPWVEVNKVDRSSPNVRSRLVVREILLQEGAGFAVEAAQPVWWPIALGIGLLIGGIAAFLSRRFRREGGQARLLGALVVLWGGVVGLAGTLLFAAWIFTDHTFWRWNENLLVASPLTLGWIVIGLRFLRGRALSQSC